MSKVKYKTGVVLPDIHAEYTDHVTMKAVYKYIADRAPDVVIQIGDFMDFNVVSSHNRGNLRAVEGQSIRQAYDIGNRIWDKIEEAAVGADIYMLEGNHDYRIERYIDEHPEARGILEVEHGLKLKERGIRWIRSWSKGEVLTIGKANFIHGLYTTAHHAKSTVDAFSENVFYGHTHDVQCFAKTKRGDNKTVVGQSLGCLCKYQQAYLNGRPTKWQQAFATFHWRPDGFFQYYTTMIFNHRFVSPEGETYDGRKMDKIRGVRR